MKKRINILPTNFSNRQKDLVLPALSPESVQIDGMTVRQKLAFCGHLSEVFTFYNIKGNPDGQWTELINSDLSIFSARILEKDNSQYFSDFSSFENAVKSAGNECLKNLFLQKYFNSIFSVLTEINNWFVKSSRDFYKNDIYNLLAESIEVEGRALLADIYKIYFGYCENHSNFKNQGLKIFSTLTKEWHFEPFPYLLDEELQQYVKISSFLNNSKVIGDQIFTYLNNLLSEINIIYENSLKRNDIAPHIGLLITFLDLFEHTNSNLNQLTAKHLNFYYRDVLKLSAKKAVADKAFLSLVLAKDKPSVSLPVNTLFKAGNTADDQPVTFGSLQAIDVNGSIISQYYACYFNAVDTLSKNGPGAFKEQIKQFNTVGLQEWSLMKGSEQQALKPEMGFAFSSTDLFLAEGERNITLTFTIDKRSAHQFKKSNKQKVSVKKIIEDFSFLLTGPKGWITAKVNSVSFTDQQLEIRLAINPSEDAIVSYVSKIHGKGFQTDWPLLKVVGGDHYYNLLSELNFKEVKIQTKVIGVKDLILENDQGKLKTGSVFMPFGSTPMPGNSWYVGNYEVFVKKQKQVTINLQWSELPLDFTLYYKNYFKTDLLSAIVFESPFRNENFKAEVSVLDGSSWDVVSGFDHWNLFTASDSSDKLENRMKVVIPGSNIPWNAELQPFKSVKTATNTGFVRFDLNSPIEGFGSELYPNAIARVTMDNGLILIKNKDKTPDEVSFEQIPNKPYIPKIGDVSLDYQSENTYSTDLLMCEQAQWYHLSFEGVTDVQMNAPSLPIVRKYVCDSYAYMAFDDADADQTMNLLFSVVGSGTETISNNYQNITYEYLSTGGWKSLTISNDTTDGFQNIGLVTWVMPDGFDLSSPLGAGLCWIRIGSNDASDTLVDFIGTNGLIAERSDVSAFKTIDPIPAGTIQKLENPVANVKSVLQPASSFGGKSHQTEPEFLLSTALRLNDKNRMMSVVDFNKMLLSTTPDLYEVATVPMVYHKPAEANSIKILVAARQEASDVNPYLPVTSPMMMRSILNCVNEYSPDNMSVQVSNYEYRPVKVNCSFVMKGPNDAGAVALVDLLNNQLKDYLSPWIKGNKLADKKSVTSDGIYSFIKSREYVEVITQFSCELLLAPSQADEEVKKTDVVFKMGERINSDTNVAVSPEKTKDALLKALRPWEMLVSADKHNLAVDTNKGLITSQKETKIGKLMISN
ncbi:MAG: hypothetical protein AAFQ94_17680 [Bacteroidota bacterium]